MNIPRHETWDVIDASKISENAQRCPRNYFFANILGWKVDKPNNHLVFGEAWHKAQEHILNHRYSPNSIVRASDLFLDMYRRSFPEETDELFEPKTPVNAIEALVKYVNHYASDPDEFEVLYTELSGSVPIDHRRVLYFRMDDILKLHNPPEPGKDKTSLEHKTKGGYFNSQWENQWILSPQNGLYTHVLYCLYPEEEVLGVKISGTSFAKTKKGCTINFTRVPIYKSKDSMRVWYWNTLRWVDDIERELLALEDCRDSDEVMMAFPMNPQGCTKYFGCPYHDFCIAWPNPLRKCDQPPLGFKQEFWDPRGVETTHKIDLKRTIEGMMEEMSGDGSGQDENRRDS